MDDAVTRAMQTPWLLWQWWLHQITMPGGFAPAMLNQPILPNGTFAGVVVNENNSSDPLAEQAIVSQQSYGRQLGQLMDALAELIGERKPAPPTDSACGKLLEMKARIDQLKYAAAAQRFERVKADLARLKTSDPETYQQWLEELPQR
jgi:hypothetical protein